MLGMRLVSRIKKNSEIGLKMDKVGGNREIMSLLLHRYFDLKRNKGGKKPCSRLNTTIPLLFRLGRGLLAQFNHKTPLLLIPYTAFPDYITFKWLLQFYEVIRHSLRNVSSA